jgi:hypothetical protein
LIRPAYRDLTVGIAREARFERHLRRKMPMIEELRRRGRGDPNVLAILAVESFFRPALARAIEYLQWLVLTLRNSEAVAGISVGHAQVQLTAWVEAGMMTTPWFSLRRLSLARSPEANYEACRRYLHAREVLGENHPGALALAYVGAPRPYYAELLATARRRLDGRGLIPRRTPRLTRTSRARAPLRTRASAFGLRSGARNPDPDNRAPRA